MLKFFKQLFDRFDQYHAVSFYDQIIDKATKLDSSRFKYVWSSNISIFYVKVPFHHVSEFTQRINQYTEMLQNRQVIGPHMFSESAARISVQRFFTNKAGHCIDEVAEGKQLLQSILQFVNLYKEKSTETEEDFVRDHNLAVLSPTLGTISNLLDELGNIPWPNP